MTIVVAAALLAFVEAASGQVISTTRLNPTAVSDSSVASLYSPDGQFVCVTLPEPNTAEPVRCASSRSATTPYLVSDILGAGKRASMRTFSPDSQWIYFIAPGLAQSELFRARPDGSGPIVRISGQPGSSTDQILGTLRFRFDRNEVAYRSIRNGFSYLDVASLQNPGIVTSLAPLILPTQDGFDFQYAVSGNRILIETPSVGDTQLYSVVTDNSDLDQLSFSGAAIPDYVVTDSVLQAAAGTRVFYASSGAGAGFDLFVTDEAGGGSTQLTSANSRSLITDVRFDADGAHICFYEYNSSILRMELSCGPTSQPQAITFHGAVTDRDEDSAMAGFILSEGNPVVLADNQTWVSAVKDGSQWRVITARLDGTGGLTPITGTYADILATRYIQSLDRLLLRAVTTAGEAPRWFLLATDGSAITPLFIEESTNAEAQFIGFSDTTNRLVFLRDVQSLTAVQFELFSIAPDASNPQSLTSVLTDSVFDNPYPRFASDGKTIVFANRYRLLFNTRTQLRAVQADGNGSVTLLSLAPGIEQTSRDLRSFRLSPTDPLGAVAVVETASDGSYDMWLTFTGTPAPLFADGFEGP